MVNGATLFFEIEIDGAIYRLNSPAITGINLGIWDVGRKWIEVILDSIQLVFWDFRT